MIVPLIEIGIAAGTLVLFKGLVEPVAVKVFDRVVMPNLSEAFAKRINPEMGVWLAEKTGEELSEAIADSLAQFVDGFSSKPQPIKEMAVKRVRKMYDPVVNADKLQQVAVSIVQEALKPSADELSQFKERAGGNAE